MNGFTKLVFLALCATSLASKLEKEQEARGQKSLLGVFPFRDQRAGGEHHHDHHDHHDHGDLAAPRRSFQTPGAPRAQRQGAEEDVALDIGSIAAAGERCVEKVVMETSTEYDDVVTCKHSYSEKCHTTYTTDFEPQQEEECDETFTKSCFIEYKKVASDEKIKFCHTPLVCEGEGPEECKTVYESFCETSYHIHDVEDDVVDCKTVYDEKCEPVSQGYTTEEKCTKWPRQECTTSKVRVQKPSPQTKCEKKPRQLCGPSGCELKPGPEECFDRTETVVQEVPEETCNLEPQKSCKFVTKLVPLLKPTEECVDIPKEVCSRSRTNPRPVKKPVVKKWCYVPTAESGLA